MGFGHQNHGIGQLVYSILAGVFGTLVLAVFLGGIFSMGALLKILPWIIGFNTLLTGYTLIDRTRERFARKRLWALGAGICNVALAFVLLNALSAYVLGGFILDGSDLLRFLIVGAVCSFLGAALGVKYFNL
jgi:hypothetical protein